MGQSKGYIDVPLTPAQRKSVRQAYQDAPIAPPSEPSSAVGRFANGVWEMVNPVSIVTGAAQMVAHSVDTYNGMVDQAAQQFVKAKDLIDQGRYVEAAGHGAAGFLPMVGPLAADIGEQAVAGDYAGAAGRLTGILAGPKIVKGVAKGAARLVPSADALEAAAARRVADVMSPKAGNQVGRRMAAKASKIAPDILQENRGGWSRAALQRQILGKLADAEGALDDAADARNNAAPIETKPTLDAIASARAKLTAQPFEAEQLDPTLAQTPANMPPQRAGVPVGQDVVPQPNQPRVAVLDQAAQEIGSLGEIAPYEALRTIRQAYDGPAKAVYNPSLVDDFLKKTGEAKGAADVTAALRKALADADPATAEANAKYALYRSASDIIDAAEQVEKAKPKVGRQIMARLTSTILGASAAGAPGAATGFILSPAIDGLVNSGFTTKLKTAQMLKAIADASRRGDVGMVQSLTYRLARMGAKAQVRVPALEASREKGLVGQE